MEKETNSSLKEQSEFIQVPCGALIANGGAVRKDGQTYLMFWKSRRNANLALKARIKYGPNYQLTLNTKTMSVYTDGQIMRDYYVPVQRVAMKPKRTKRKVPKGMRYAI